MAIKKPHINPTKKSDAKKKIISTTSTIKSENAKHTIRKKLNEFGDNDSL